MVTVPLLSLQQDSYMTAEDSSKGFQVILHSLPMEGREQLLEDIRSRRAESGAPLVVAGNANEVVAIVSGQASLRMPVEGGSWIEIGRCGPGEIFGFESFMQGSVEPLEVVALGPCLLQVLDGCSFQRLLMRFPSVYLGITRVLSRRLETAQAILRDQRLKSAPKRPLSDRIH